MEVDRLAGMVNRTRELGRLVGDGYKKVTNANAFSRGSKDGYETQDLIAMMAFLRDDEIPAARAMMFSAYVEGMLQTLGDKRTKIFHGAAQGFQSAIMQ